MNTLLYGPAGTGKTTVLLNKYIELKKENPFRNDVYYLVPTKEHADRIKVLVLSGIAVTKNNEAIIEKINPLFYDNIKTFDEFVCSKKYLLQDIDKQMIFHSICIKLKSKLTYFYKKDNEESQENILANPAFHAGLSELIDELKNYCIDLSVFYKKLPNSEKAKDLEKIFTEYKNYLVNNNLQDKEDILAAYTPPEEKSYIFIDGFTEFTPLQHSIIQKLTQGEHSVWLTLLLNKTEDKFFKHIEETAVNKLLPLFQTQTYLSNNSYHQATELQTIALHWGEKFKSRKYVDDRGKKQKKVDLLDKLPACENINILSAGNRLEEIEAIAREIHSLVPNLVKKEDGSIDWSDIAIIFRSIGSYQALINDVFLYYGIPVEIYEGIELRNQFIAWILGLRDITDKDKKLDLENKACLLALLKSAYAKLEVTDFISQMEEDIANLTTQEEILQKAPKITKYLEKIFGYANTLHNANNFREIKTVLEKFYAENECLKTLELDKNHKDLQTAVRHNNRAYTRLLEILDKLQDWQTKLNLSFTAEELWQRMLYSLQEMTSARVRNSNQVQVYDALSARQKDYKIVFIADLTVNSFPAGSSETVLLKDYEKDYFRDSSGAPLFKQSPIKTLNENLLFYQTLTRAKEKLYLCYPTREAAGGELKSSQFITQVIDFMAEKLDKKIEILSYNYSDILSQEQPLCKPEFRELAAFRAYSKPEQITALSQKEKDLYALNEVIRQKYDAKQITEFQENNKKELAQLNHRISAKKLETYSRCGYRFFYEAVLKLRGKPDENKDFIISVGYILHDTLQAYYKEGYYTENKPTVSETMDIVLRNPEYKHRLENNTHLLPKQIEVEYARLRKILEVFVAHDKEKYEARQYTPSGFEEKYDFTLEDNTVPLVIDRIDKQGNNFLIMDYKTGFTPSIKADEIKKGILPQVWIYALAYQHLTKNTIPVAAEYCSIKNPKKRIGLYDKTAEKLTSPKSHSRLERQDFDTLIDTAEKNIKKYFKAIQEGKFPTPADTEDNPDTCNYCPAGDICRDKAEQTDDE